MENKHLTAVITGVTGMCGYYLSNYLLNQGYQVIGIDRRTSMPTYERLIPLMDKPGFCLVPGDITDLSSIQGIIKKWQPDEFYSLAAMSFVGDSWEQPILIAQITGLGVLNCLEAIRKIRPQCKFYQSSSSEMFGNHDLNGRALNENSSMIPDSPYAAAKLFGHSIVGVYRRSHGMFAACGIMFNTEGPLRGEEFVTKKITKSLALIRHGLQKKIKLGNISAYRDWSFVGDSVKAMHSIMQLEKPNDYIIATGETHSVKEFLQIACNWYNLKIENILEIDESYKRPKDVGILLGDYTKLNEATYWKPEINFKDLVELMCQHDYYYYSPNPNLRAQALNYLYPKRGN